MSAPPNRHAAVRAALHIEHCFEPDAGRQVRAILAVLKRAPTNEPAARDSSSQAAEAEEPQGAHPNDTPARS